MTMTTAIPEEVVPQSEHVPTLLEHLWHHVDVRRRQPALHGYAHGTWSTTTWEEFGAAIRAVSAFLVDEGVPEGAHAAIWSGNRGEWHIADAAILSAHLCTTPVYHSLSPTEAAYVLGHSESSIAFVDTPVILERLLSMRHHLPAIRRIVCFDLVEDSSEDGFVISWEEAVRRGTAALEAGAGDEVDRRIAAVTPDDVATLVYTSGTTGPPKAVMITHRNVDSAVGILTSVIPVSPDDRVLSYLPLAHVAERVSSEYRQFVFGNAVHFAPSIELLPTLLREVRPTTFVGVPRVWEKIADRVRRALAEQPAPRRLLANWAIGRGRAVLTCREGGREPGTTTRWTAALADRLVLRRIRETLGLDRATVLITAAAPISGEVLRFFHSLGLPVSELYGMSEDCGVTSVNPIGRARIGSVGPPLPGVELQFAPDGEILVRCGAVFAGYYKDPAATAETVVDGWLHTGDVGELDEAGYLHITDRKKDLLITAGGKNISPSNIEVALKTHPLVSNAVAIGDQRPYVTALLTTDRSELEEFAHEHELTGTVAELVENPVVHEAIQQHVNAVNAELAPVEQVKRWQLLATDFTVGEELTPTFKVRRKVVAERYAAVIEENYR